MNMRIKLSQLPKVSDIAEIKDDKLTMVSRENKSLQEEHASNKITYVHAYPYCQMSLQL